MFELCFYRRRARRFEFALTRKRGYYARGDLVVEIVEFEDDVGEEFVIGVVDGVKVGGRGVEIIDEGVYFVGVFDVEGGVGGERANVGEVVRERRRGLDVELFVYDEWVV